MTDAAWLEKTFLERLGLLAEKYGKPGAIVPLPDETAKIAKLARGNVLLFPPAPPKRPHWLYTTIGLSQPAADDGKGDARKDEDPRRSGFGFEFAVLSKEPDDWAPLLLLQLVTFSMEHLNDMKPGARIPFAFTKPRDENVKDLKPVIGQFPQDHVPAGEVVSLLVWPCLDLDGPFVSSTGRFDLLAATAITRDEWELAKATSSLHVLELLRLMKIGQTSDPLRKSATADSVGQVRWEKVKALSKDQIMDALYGPA